MTGHPAAAPGDGMDIASARSLLFVPGDRSDRFGTARASAADLVIVDLEDAVRPERRSQARANLRNLSGVDPSPGDAPVLVRVNPFGSDGFVDDVEAAIAAGAVGIVLAKFVPGPIAHDLDHDLAVIERRLGRPTPLPVVGLIESAAGVLGLSAGFELPTRLARLAWGAADYYLDLGLPRGSSGIHTELAMATLVLASAAAGLPAPLDSPCFSVADEDVLNGEVIRARQLGFGGKLCIHPRQVAAVNSGFGQSEFEVSWAQSVVESWDDPSRAGAGAIRVGDELVDEAVVRRARQVLNRSWPT